MSFEFFTNPSGRHLGSLNNQLFRLGGAAAPDATLMNQGPFPDNQDMQQVVVRIPEDEVDADKCRVLCLNFGLEKVAGAARGDQEG